VVGDARSIELRVEAGYEQVRLICVTVRAVAERFLATPRAQLIELCTAEIAGNCVRYAYANEPGHRLRVCIGLDDEYFVVEVRDRGKTFASPQPSDQTSLSDAGSQDCEGRAGEGMRLALVSAMAESADYFRDGDENVMRMRFPRLRSSSPRRPA